MAISEARQKAKSAAESVIEAQNLKAPFSVSSVARFYGIDVIVASSSEILNKVKSVTGKDVPINSLAGFYDKLDKIFYVPENDNNNLPRQRFTVAHELGHHVMGHSNSFRVLNKRDLYDFSEQKNEIEANYFASYLLAPDEDLKKFKPFIEFYPEGILISKLSDALLLSEETVRIRLKSFFEENPDYAPDE